MFLDFVITNIPKKNIGTYKITKTKRTLPQTTQQFGNYQQFKFQCFFFQNLPLLKKKEAQMQQTELNVFTRIPHFKKIEDPNIIQASTF